MDKSSFWRLLKTWILPSKSVTFNRGKKLGEKCQNWKIKMRQFLTLCYVYAYQLELLWPTTQKLPIIIIATTRTKKGVRLKCEIIGQSCWIRGFCSNLDVAALSYQQWQVFTPPSFSIIDIWLSRKRPFLHRLFLSSVPNTEYCQSIHLLEFSGQKVLLFSGYATPKESINRISEENFGVWG